MRWEAHVWVSLVVLGPDGLVLCREKKDLQRIPSVDGNIL